MAEMEAAHDLDSVLVAGEVFTQRSGRVRASGTHKTTIIDSIMSCTLRR